MDVFNKKSIKKTSAEQFKVLVRSMDEFPELATASPIFGKSKLLIEGKWDLVAQRINAIGPPTRSGSVWKKIWADLKCRTKAKIAANAKQMTSIGGGSSCFHLLTDLENDIDRICHLSAAVPSDNNTFGVTLKPASNRAIVLETTPPRISKTVAVVTPTTLEQSDPQCTKLLSTPNSSLHRLQKSTTTQRKRKNPENNSVQNIQIKLLKSQVEQNGALIDEMRTQTRELGLMAKSLCGIESSMKEILNFLKEE